jgi:hypothetical protein
VRLRLEHRITRRALPLAVVLALGWLSTLASPASSAFTAATPPVGPTVSTGTLAAPTGLAAVKGACTILTSNSVNLSWTATSSTWADGYIVFRSTTSGSGYAAIATVSGRSTTAYVDASPAFSTTYFYVVQATRNLWRSPNSNQASVTTPTVLCV